MFQLRKNPNVQNHRLDILLTAVSVAAATIATIAYVQVHRTLRPSPPSRSAPPKEPLSLEGAPLYGSEKAPVAILEFSDFECPYCAVFTNTVLPSLTTKYVEHGLVSFWFRQFPLPIHPHAVQAAQSALCAAQQGRFWEMHDALFANQDMLSRPQLLSHGAAIGLDAQLFRKCLDGPPFDSVATDQAQGEAAGVTGTPTFFVGKRNADGRLVASVVLQGARSAREFDQAISPMLPTAGRGAKAE